MNLDMALRGSLANLPDNHFSEAAFLRELENHGFSADDGHIALDKALLEGLLQRTDDGLLAKQARELHAESSKPLAGPGGTAPG